MQVDTLLAVLATALLMGLSFALSPRVTTPDGFFRGLDRGGRAPGLATLVLSQVTTWIFARSLMNSAILGYYYGIAGTLAYAAYYASFLTGCIIVMRIRAEGGMSVQAHHQSRFGRTGTLSYNVVVALRLLSEVFSNLLVIGLIFSALLPETAGAGTVAILAVGALGLATLVMLAIFRWRRWI